MQHSGNRDRPYVGGRLRWIRRRGGVIALSALLGAGLGLAWSWSAARSHSASAGVLIPAPATGSPQRLLADELQVARGDLVRQGATAALGYRAGIHVSGSPGADVLTFTAHSASRSQAASIANAYAGAFIDDGGARVGLALPARPTLLRAAVTPGPTTSRTLIRSGVLGLAVGLLVGIAIALLLDRLDGRVTSRRVAEQECGGRPCVALIPEVRSWRRPGPHLVGAEDSGSGITEAYRVLGLSLPLMSSDETNRVIAVTGSVGGEGATTVVANLAVFFARSGRRVVAVSADLRRPRLHQSFGIGNDTGLTSLFSGQATLADILVPVAGEPRLRVIPSGPPAAKPAEALSLDGVRRLCGVLRDNADVVLIDSPPVLPVADALLLSPLVDGIVLVATAGTTSRKDLRRAHETLDLVHAPVLGTVLNRVPTRGRRVHAYRCELSPGPGAAQPDPPVTTRSEPPDPGAVPTASRGPAVDLRAPNPPAAVPGGATTIRPDSHLLVDYSHEFRPSKVPAR
jgi:tyrosine-protein kinase